MNINEIKTSILVVDDNPRNLKLLGIILRPLDYELFIAGDGPHALEILDKTNIDLVLLDIMMPDMNGYEVCEKIKSNERTADVPVVFLTAKVDPSDLVAGFEAGAIDYIKKPFNQSELIARIKTHIELKKAKDMLKLQNDELQKLNATKDRFFSIVAHDLKNPLGAIRDLTSSLAEAYDDFTEEEKKDFLHEMKNSSKTLYELLENLLTWSRSQRNLIQFTPDYFHLDFVVKNCVSTLSLLADNKQIQIIDEVPEEFEVWADANMVTTIVRNLISNALKFTPEGGNITIRSVADGEIAKVSISDTGVGISPANLKKLFRIDSAFTTKGTSNEAGTGLGLILCQEFVERHGGTIGVESELGQGTTFNFTLDLRKKD